MKKLFSLISLLILSIAAFSQSKLYIRGDSIFLQRDPGNSELILLNGTRTRTNSFLKNLGNGRTGFGYAVDSAYVSGTNLVLRRGDGNLTLAVPGVASPIDPVLALGGSFTANRTMNISTYQFGIASGSFLSKFYYDTVGALTIENNAGAALPGHNSPALWIKNSDPSNSEQIGFLNNNGENVGDIGTSNLDSSFQIRANVPSKFLQIAMHPTTGYNMPIFRLQNNGAINWVSYNNAATVNWNAKFDLYNNRYILGDTVDISDVTNNYKLQVKGDVGLNAANPKIHFRATGVTQPYTTGDFPATGVGRILPVSSTTGGLLISGFSSGDNLPLLFQGIIGSTTPTGSPIIFRAYKSDGATSVVGLGNSEKIFSIQNSATETFGQLGDGTTTLSKYAGTGTRLPNVSSTGVIGAITNGSDGQVMTLVSGAPAWAAGGGSSTTISNNANNRVITGSGTANTLEAESTFTWDGTLLIATAALPEIELLATGVTQPYIGGGFPTTGIGRIKYIDATTGGLLTSGFSAGDANPYLVQGVIGSTTPTTAQAIVFRSYKADGAGSVVALGSAEKVFSIQNASTEIFLQSGDGGTTLSSYAGTGDDLAYFNSAGKFVRSTTEITNVATLASPTFTGTPAAPTAAPGTNTTQIATTAFVTAATANFTGGTFTPTETDITNIATSTSNAGEWIRVGERISYAGSITITATSPSSLCEIDITLPIASNLGSSFELNGTVGSDTVFGYVYGNSTDDKARIAFVAPASGSPGTVRYTFIYKVTPP